MYVHIELIGDVLWRKKLRGPQSPKILIKILKFRKFRKNSKNQKKIENFQKFFPLQKRLK